MIRTRKHRIEIIKRRLVRRSWPRLQVSLILLSTGLAGFLTSFSLLHLGIPWMWLRYPIAIVFAYCVFLLLLRFWLSLHRTQSGIFDIGLELFQSATDVGFTGSPGVGEGFEFSGGGDAGGGGAGGSWGESISSASTSSHSSIFDGLSFDLDLEEGWLIVIAIIALIGGLFATLYIVYIAPALLAEVLIDGALVAGLYRRVERIEQRHWLRAALRQTVLPALLVAILFTVAGYAMQRAVPRAHSMGEVWKFMWTVER
jgi:hypothetical protein